jgi:signal recognition particle GTPase
MEDPVAVSAVHAVHVIDYPENPYFVARDSLLELIDSKLKPQNSDLDFVRKTPAFTIWGGGGQGKTQTASQFAYTHLDDFPAILWIAADTAQKLLEGLAEYALRLKLVEKLGDSVRDAAKLIDWFKTTGSTNSNLAFDHLSLIVSF